VAAGGGRLLVRIEERVVGGVDHQVAVPAARYVAHLRCGPSLVFARQVGQLGVCDHMAAAADRSLWVLDQPRVGLCLVRHISGRRFATPEVVVLIQSIRRWGLHRLCHLVAQAATLGSARVRSGGPVRGSLQSGECPLRASEAAAL